MKKGGIRERRRGKRGKVEEGEVWRQSVEGGEAAVFGRWRGRSFCKDNENCSYKINVDVGISIFIFDD